MQIQNIAILQLQKEIKQQKARESSMQSQLDLLTTNIAQISKQLNDMRLLLTEEQKNDDTEDIRKEIRIIRDNVDELMNNNSPKKEIDSPVIVWLRDRVKLPEYVDLFMENGLDDMSVISDISMKELNLIGITKIGHKMRILKEITKLKQPQQNQPIAIAPAVNDGGSTAYI